MVASSSVPSHEGDWEHYPKKFGKYHLLAPLAQGGMGALYLAVAGDRGLERMMVIKTVLPHLADAEYVARFRDEGESCSETVARESDSRVRRRPRGR